MAGVSGLQIDFKQQVVNVHWGGGCRFAVCGYVGRYEGAPLPQPVYNGVGAYSQDGKSWTVFQEFENGSMVIAFHMADPNNKGQNILIVGGCINNDSPGISTSTASLKTILGSGPSATGGTSDGRNVANFGSVGYDKDNHILYAVENSGDGAATASLRSFELGTGPPLPPDFEPPTPSSEESVLWAGAHSSISPVRDCGIGAGGILTMTYKDKDGNHTLTINSEEMLFLDGNDITPSGIYIHYAAGGANDGGDSIIIATGYDEEDNALALWSVKGQGWNEISGIWTGPTELQAPQLAIAVPNP